MLYYINQYFFIYSSAAAFFVATSLELPSCSFVHVHNDQWQQSSQPANTLLCIYLYILFTFLYSSHTPTIIHHHQQQQLSNIPPHKKNKND